MPDFNFDDTEAVERKLLPVGWYNLIVDSCEPKKSKSGKKMLSLMFRVDGGEYDQQPIFQNFMLEGKAGGITKAFLRAATGNASGGARSTEDLIGCTVSARLTQKVWAEVDGGDGELQNNIVKYRAVSTEGGVFG